MEEAEGEINNNDIIQTRKISVNTGEIIKKFNSFEDWQMLYQELNKIIPIFFIFIFSKGCGLDSTFF